jgi:hypothetical protein
MRRVLTGNTPAWQNSLHFFEVEIRAVVYYKVRISRSGFKMKDKNREQIESRLQEWKLEIEGDPMLKTHVMNRIATEEKSDSFPIWRIRWIGALAAAALIALSAFLISQQLERTRHVEEGGYALLIDPVSRAKIVSRNPVLNSSESLVQRLSFMQSRLDLSQEQFLELVELHKGYNERFNLIYEELVALEDQYSSFEELRMENEAIDFMALYDVLSKRQETEGRARMLSEDLISHVVAILKPDQRNIYLSMVRS